MWDLLVILDTSVHLALLGKEVLLAGKVSSVSEDQLEFLAQLERQVPLEKKGTKVMWVQKVIRVLKVKKVTPELLEILVRKVNRVNGVHQVHQV